MAEDSQGLRQRIGTLEELGSVFGALRAMSASRLQQAQASFAGIERYASAVVDAIGVAWPLVPPTEAPPGGRRIRVSFGSEHGFCGAFDDRVLRAEPAGPAERWIVGRRLASAARERGLDVAWSCPAATQATGVLDTARRVATRLYEVAAKAPLASLTLQLTAYVEGVPQVRRQELLPWAPAGAPVASDLPLLHLPPERLLAALVDEVVLAELTRAAMTSFAAECEARLRAMQAALDHVRDRVEELRRDEARLRQEEVTTELLDVVNGAEAAGARR